MIAKQMKMLLRIPAEIPLPEPEKVIGKLPWVSRFPGMLQFVKV